MNTADLLSLVIKHNREIMDLARLAMDAAELDSREWQEAYQILKDAGKAFDDARRAAQYGFPGIE